MHVLYNPIVDAIVISVFFFFFPHVFYKLSSSHARRQRWLRRAGAGMFPAPPWMVGQGRLGAGWAVPVPDLTSHWLADPGTASSGRRVMSAQPTCPWLGWGFFRRDPCDRRAVVTGRLDPTKWAPGSARHASRGVIRGSARQRAAGSLARFSVVKALARRCASARAASVGREGPIPCRSAPRLLPSSNSGSWVSGCAEPGLRSCVAPLPRPPANRRLTFNAPESPGFLRRWTGSPARIFFAVDPFSTVMPVALVAD